MKPQDLFGGVTELGKAAKHRFDDATALLSQGRWRAAMYLAGYAIECRLKSKLMKKYRCNRLRTLGEKLVKHDRIHDPNDIFTHAIEVLLRLTDRAEILRRDAKRWPAFSIVNAWVPAWRYTASLSTEDESEEFLSATRVILEWVENNV